jgi:hypothetical protein
VTVVHLASFTLGCRDVALARIHTPYRLILLRSERGACSGSQKGSFKECALEVSLLCTATHCTMEQAAEALAAVRTVSVYNLPD